MSPTGRYLDPANPIFPNRLWMFRPSKMAGVGANEISWQG